MNLPPLVKKVLAEFLGVMLFLTAIVGAAVYSQSPLGSVALATVLGLAIFVTAPISGGHLNPVVSVYFFSRREISLSELLSYLAAQFFGAIVGAFIATQMFLQQFSISTNANQANSGSLLSELFITGGWVWLVGRLSSTGKGQFIPMTVALWVFAGVVFSSSGAQANPAVSVALIFLGQASAQTAAYILAHLAGMLIAAIFVLVFAERKKVMVESASVSKSTVAKKPAVTKKPAAKKTASK
jgi:glycerol uptake facilitator-like aquaporin